MDPRNVGLLASFLVWLVGQSWLPLPLYVFAVICWFALVMDVNAQPDARRQISLRLNPKKHTKEQNDAIAIHAIRAAFDLLYGLPFLLTRGRRDKRKLGDADWRPLKAWWAFFPSMLLTVVATWLLTHLLTSSDAGVDIKFWSKWAGDNAFWSGMAVNIISDFLALFAIRKWLFADGVSPLTALISAPALGLLLVISFTGLRLVSFMMVYVLFLDPCASPDANVALCPSVSADNSDNLAVSYLAMWDGDAVKRMLPALSWLHFPGVLAAWIVHLWLPAFAALAAAVHLLNWVLYWMLRWIKGHQIVVEWYFGKNHPVLALGVCAGGAAAAVIRLLQFMGYVHP